jgi:hypothetical protein
LSSTGATGDRQGFWAADLQYFYYCVVSYTNGVAHIWKRISWSGDTW